MTTPFVAFRTPDVSPLARPEALALGLGLGALLGGSLPVLAVMAELAAGATLGAVLASPGPSLLVSLLAPALSGVLGAFVLGVLTAHRDAYDAISLKAGSLVDEAWDLRGQLEAVADGTAPPVPMDIREDLAPDGAWDSGEPPSQEPGFDLDARRTLREQEALIEAQTRLLHSMGSATQDAARRMQVNLRGLMLTPMTVVQERLVTALADHLHGVRELSEDIVSYADEDLPHDPGEPARGRARAVA